MSLKLRLTHLRSLPAGMRHFRRTYGRCMLKKKSAYDEEPGYALLLDLLSFPSLRHHIDVQ